MDFLGLIIVFLGGFFGAFYGTITGGMALITIPILMFSGLPPQMAVATNKLGALGLVFSGMYKFGKSKKIDYRIGSFLAILTFLGAIVGANLLLIVDEVSLKSIIIILMIIALAVIILKNKVGVKKRVKKISKREWSVGGISGFILGIYLGFFGGAVATFFSFLLVILFGQTFLESAGTRKLIFLPPSLIALFIFILNGIVNWQAGIVLFLGCLIGSYIGAWYSIRKGNIWIRRLFIIIVPLMILGILLL